jgi:hypothetical protein
MAYKDKAFAGSGCKIFEAFLAPELNLYKASGQKLKLLF